ncbi:MAG: hypothetical protein DRJ64_07400 [Thermoprotei archaeon]|nr:MAG: hypothetical protein DRJ64_07400 [Thermoprotei archaeon]
MTLPECNIEDYRNKEKETEEYWYYKKPKPFRDIYIFQKAIQKISENNTDNDASPMISCDVAL